MLKVFVSSTAVDLRAHREAIREALMQLQMHPVMMEDFNATDAGAVEKCQREVVDSDVFVGIYAYRYGFIPPNQHHSITEMEYDWAAERKIPRLLFMVDPAYAWDEKFKDTDPTAVGLLAAFKRRLDSEKVRATFTTPDALATKVVTSLAEMEREGSIKPRQQQRQTRIVAGLILLLFLVIAGAVGVNQYITRTQIEQAATVSARIAFVATQTAAAFTPTPTPLPKLKSASFNVAIAQFALEPGTTLSEGDAQQLSEAFTDNFKVRISEINGELSHLGGTIGIWEPSDIGIVDDTASDTEDRGPQALIQRLRDRQNARVDLLVYGTIRQNGNKVEVSPTFYNAYPSPELIELHGRFELESALAAPGETLLSGLTAQLTDRAQVLALITQGIVLTVVSPPQYDRARTTYAEALDINPDDRNGQALIYVLMGNASMSDYNRLAAIGRRDDADHMTALLDQAQQDFESASARNSNYARAYAGLGGVLYQRTVRNAAPGNAWSSIPESEIAAITDEFYQARSASDSPPTADIPTKVNFGLGEVALLKFLAGDSAQADIALDYFNKVTTEYGQADNPSNSRVREFAAQAYGFIGLIRDRQNQASDAISAYDQAISLTQLDVRSDLFQRARLYIEIEDRRSKADIDGAVSAYQSLFALNLQPDEAAKAYSREGKMLSEAGKPADALAAYEQGVQLQDQIDPVLAAQLWEEIGNKRYDLGDLAGCIEAYQNALLLNPQGEQQLQKYIDETATEMAAASATPPS